MCLRWGSGAAPAKSLGGFACRRRHQWRRAKTPLFSGSHRCRSLAGGAAGAGGRAALPRLAAGAILGARFRPALALLAGPGQPAPLALVHVHAPAGAQFLLASRFECSSLCGGEIYAELHSFGRLAKPGAKRQPLGRGHKNGPALTSTLRKNPVLLSLS